MDQFDAHCALKRTLPPAVFGFTNETAIPNGSMSHQSQLRGRRHRGLQSSRSRQTKSSDVICAAKCMPAMQASTTTAKLFIRTQ